MPRRYGFTATRRELQKRFHADVAVPELTRRYNIAATQSLPVVINQATPIVTPMRWGLIPSWATDDQIGSRTINARAETLAEKPSYRQALRFQRAIIPASFFYAWRETEHGKVPYYLFAKDETIMGFAGLYAVWKSPTGAVVHSYTIITVPPNAYMQPIADRMPAILRREDERRWLDPDLTDPQRVLPLLRPYPSEQIDGYTIGRDVNSPAIDTVDLITPVAYRFLSE